ncbi:HAMP domain-containing protein [Kurthia zopfii]|uniref:HAMP domain-containing protein n=1 Tax=Kurthia zopfii TaxID=1650 RepID=UPI000F70FB27|nr:methyl-accepting chemotaxis protein [Kurthia zopfii]VEI07214.1 H3 [Kurthia zopfii]
MKNLFNFKSIKTKILFSFAIVFVFVLVYSYISLTAFKEIRATTENMIQQEMKLQIANEKAASNFAIQVSSVRGYIITGNQIEASQFDLYDEKRLENEEIINKLSNKEFAKDLMDRTNQWSNDVRTKIIDEYAKGNEKVAIANQTSISATTKEILASYDQLTTERAKQVTKEGEDLVALTKKIQIFTFILALITVLSATIISVITARIISRPLVRITKKLSTIADGDLTLEKETMDRKDEIGQLNSKANLLLDRLRDMMGTMQHVSQNVANQSDSLAQAADEIKQGSNQIAITMQELAEGSEEQASNASDLASTTDGFVSVIKHASENGQKIFNSSTAVLTYTNDGSDLMQQSYGVKFLDALP